MIMMMMMIKEPVVLSDSDRTADATTGRVLGVLLAAGAGRRAGGPKALRVDADGTSWLLRSIAVLRDGGCDAVIVVLGCEAERAHGILADSALAADPAIMVVDAPDWEHGMGSSLRSGLLAARAASWRAALVHLVDLPDVTADVVRRLIRQAPAGTSALLRAAYAGTPGHPVLIGRDHLEPIMTGLAGDRGAQDYLARHGAHSVECGDLASGQDDDGQRT
jgi:CTP:molybdopterin cytidylyltransferase MocA